VTAFLQRKACGVAAAPKARRGFRGEGAHGDHEVAGLVFRRRGSRIRRFHKAGNGSLRLSFRLPAQYGLWRNRRPGLERLGPPALPYSFNGKPQNTLDYRFRQPRPSANRWVSPRPVVGIFFFSSAPSRPMVVHQGPATQYTPQLGQGVPSTGGIFVFSILACGSGGRPRSAFPLSIECVRPARFPLPNVNEALSSGPPGGRPHPAISNCFFFRGD